MTFENKTTAQSPVAYIVTTKTGLFRAERSTYKDAENVRLLVDKIEPNGAPHRTCKLIDCHLDTSEKRVPADVGASQQTPTLPHDVDEILREAQELLYELSGEDTEIDIRTRADDCEDAIGKLRAALHSLQSTESRSGARVVPQDESTGVNAIFGSCPDLPEVQATSGDDDDEAYNPHPAPSLGAVQFHLSDTDQRYVDALAEIEAWKNASGLVDAHGDPDGITPDIAQKHWEEVERERDEWKARAEAAADKALRFDLDQAGIEQREAEAVELVSLRAKVAKSQRMLGHVKMLVDGKEYDYTHQELPRYPATVADDPQAKELSDELCALSKKAVRGSHEELVLKEAAWMILRLGEK